MKRKRRSKKEPDGYAQDKTHKHLLLIASLIFMILALTLIITIQIVGIINLIKIQAGI